VELDKDGISYVFGFGQDRFIILNKIGYDG
jgi:hypothetical protein